MDDLDVLLDQQEDTPLPDQAPRAEALEALERYAKAAGGSMPDLAVMDPDTRAIYVAEHAQMALIENAARTRRKALELAMVRAGVDLEAQELRFTGGTIRLEPQRAAYRIKEQVLRAELLELVEKGHLEREEVDAAIHEEISYKADNRKLNGLLKRGKLVKESVERNRTKVEPDPLQATPRINRGKK